jgi:hypothetical protein
MSAPADIRLSTQAFDPGGNCGIYEGNTTQIQRVPNKYGGQQASYLQLSNELIQKAVVDLRQSISEKNADIKKIFFNLFDSFCEQRRMIAKQHGTPNWELFGSLRTKTNSNSFRRNYTPLKGDYPKYDAKIRDLILGKYLPAVLKDKVVKVGDANSQVHLHLFDIPTQDEIKLFKKDIASGGHDEEEALRKIRANDPVRSRKLTEIEALRVYNNELMDLSCNLFDPALAKVGGVIAATVYMRIGKALIEGAEYILVYHVDSPPEKFIESMRPPVLITHMRAEFIDACMEELAAIFERIVKAEKPDGATLIKNLAEFRYKFAFCFPCHRGSAAIGEWFESTMAALHNFKVTQPQDVVLDVEAFAYPYMPFFEKKYAELVKLVSLEQT